LGMGDGEREKRNAENCNLFAIVEPPVSIGP